MGPWMLHGSTVDPIFGFPVWMASKDPNNSHIIIKYSTYLPYELVWGIFPATVPIILVYCGENMLLPKMLVGWDDINIFFPHLHQQLQSQLGKSGNSSSKESQGSKHLIVHPLHLPKRFALRLDGVTGSTQPLLEIFSAKNTTTKPESHASSGASHTVSTGSILS